MGKGEKHIYRLGPDEAMTIGDVPHEEAGIAKEPEAGNLKAGFGPINLALDLICDVVVVVGGDWVSF